MAVNSLSPGPKRGATGRCNGGVRCNAVALGGALGARMGDLGVGEKENTPFRRGHTATDFGAITGKTRVRTRKCQQLSAGSALTRG